MDPYQTIAEVVAALQAIQAKRPDAEVRVAVPTLYGTWLQETPGIRRSIGDELAPKDLDDVRWIRSQIEAAGFPCDGWGVPLCDDAADDVDDYAEGALHGAVAACFDRYYLNLEAGWAGFLARTKWRDAAAAERFGAGLWGGIDAAGRTDALNGAIGITWVPNSMLTALSDDAKRAWAGLSNVDLLEVYLPGDPGLDPYQGRATWLAEAARLGLEPRPVVDLVEKGDLADYLVHLSDPAFGMGLWTLATTAPIVGALPDPLPVAARETPADYPFPDWRQSAIAYRGALDATVPQLDAARTELARSKADLAAAHQQAASDTEAFRQQIKDLQDALEAAQAAAARTDHLEAVITQIRTLVAA